MNTNKKMGGKRPGAGRPRAVGGKKSVEMGLVLSDELARDLELSAGELGITKGELLRRLAKKGLTEKQQSTIIRPEGVTNGKKKSA